jgi:hypothetical protein
MKLKQVNLSDEELIIAGKGKTISKKNLFKLFVDFDCHVCILEDFNNNKIENDLIDSWRVLYYFPIGDFTLTFSIEEYDFVYQTLKSYVRNIKINEVLN